MMTIIVDNELGTMSLFENEAERIPYITIAGGFTDSREALRYVQCHTVDLAVICVSMPELDGIELGMRLREINPLLQLVYVVDSEDRAMEAIRFRAAAYVAKPYAPEDIRYAFEIAYALSKHKTKRIYARTFGYFDLFLDGKPIIFKSAKAKELLALLVDRRGGVVDSEQIIATLWEGRPNDEATQSLCSKLCKTLYTELKSNGIEDLLISSRSSRSINLDMLNCDLYEMLDGKSESQKLYYGEYLTDYEWAEYRNYSLSKFV